MVLASGVFAATVLIANLPCFARVIIEELFIDAVAATCVVFLGFSAAATELPAPSM